MLVQLLILLAVLSQSQASSIMWPLPHSLNSTIDGETLRVTPCDVNYLVESSSIVEEAINFYLRRICGNPLRNDADAPVIMNVVVRSIEHLVATDIRHEKYQVIVRKAFNGKYQWELSADYYVGFLRAFETYTQLFQNDGNGFFIQNIPILIEDQPDFLWRGLMIDTSRHYLPLDVIKKTIEGMLYSKLNILHWHIIDEDSFPMEVPARPQLSESGKIGGTYSPADLQEIINYAQYKGVRVIPEIDTPAHTQSWGRSEKYQDITLLCTGSYFGQFDPTKNLTWEVLMDVLKYTGQKFPDEYIHFGGDQVTYQCWNQTWILQFMKENNVSSFKELSVLFRQKQKQLWRKNSDKKVIYWANEEIDLPLQDEDIIQWWGDSSTVDHLKGRPNQVILSNYDQTYLDCGFGSWEGGDYKTFIKWRQVYDFNPNFEGVNVLGGEVCMWDQIGNQYTHEQKVFLRANAFSERLWNSKIDVKKELRNVAIRLQAQASRLRSRGFKVSPVTVGLCENDMSYCF